MERNKLRGKNSASIDPLPGSASDRQHPWKVKGGHRARPNLLTGTRAGTGFNWSRCHWRRRGCLMESAVLEDITESAEDVKPLPDRCSQDPDFPLVEAALGGDASAFEELVRRYDTRLLR